MNEVGAGAGQEDLRVSNRRLRGGLHGAGRRRDRFECVGSGHAGSPAETGVGRLLFEEQFGQRDGFKSVGDAWQHHGICDAKLDGVADQRELRLQFPVRAISCSASTARWPRPISTANSPAPNFTPGPWTPNMNWLRQRNRTARLFGRSVAALRERRFRRRRNRLAAARRGQSAHSPKALIWRAGPRASASNTSSRRNYRWGWNISTPISARGLPVRTTASARHSPGRRKCTRPRSRPRACWAGSTTSRLVADARSARAVGRLAHCRAPARHFSTNRTIWRTSSPSSSGAWP